MIFNILINLIICSHNFIVFFRKVEVAVVAVCLLNVLLIRQLRTNDKLIRCMSERSAERALIANQHVIEKLKNKN